MNKATQTVVSKLKQANYRMTPIRKQIIELFSHGHEIYSAMDVLQKLSVAGVDANKTTVYRELEFLTAQNILKVVSLNDNLVRYEMIDGDDHHHHLICRECGKVDVVQFPEDFEKLENNVQEQQGFKIDEHNLEFFGHCSNCQD